MFLTLYFRVDLLICLKTIKKFYKEKKKIGNDTTNKQSLFNFFGKTQKNQLQKMKKTPENSMTTKHFCKQNEFVKI